MEGSNEDSKITIRIRWKRMEQQLEAMKEASGYIIKLHNGVETTISYFRNNELEKAYHLLIQIIEGLGWVYDVIRLTQEAQVEKIDSNDLKLLSSEMVEAMENQDNDLLADLLEFELMSKLEVWDRQLKDNIR